MKVLIISTNAIGDSYLSASAIQCIKRKYQNVQIDFVTTAESVFIFSNLGNLTLHLVNKNIISVFAIFIKISINKYEYVFNFFPGIVNSFFFIFTRSKFKAGYQNYFRVSDWYTINQKVKTKNFSSRKAIWNQNDNYLDRIKLVLNISGFDTKLLSKKIIPQPIVSMTEFSNTIVIHPFSRESSRALSLGLIKKLCKMIRLKCDKEIILIGRDHDFSIELKYYLNGNAIKWLTNITLVELVEIICSTYFFVGVDSFPLHVADSYNKNFVGLFSCTKPTSVLINSTKAYAFQCSSFEKITEDEFGKILIDNKFLD